MPSYYDIITQETREIDDTTILYLIKCDNAKVSTEINKYSIKAISVSIEKLNTDPTSRTNQYWPINKEQLVNQAINKNLYELVFPNNSLTTQSLSLKQIKTLLNYDPTKTASIMFVAKKIEDDIISSALTSPHSPNNDVFYFTNHHLISSIFYSHRTVENSFETLNDVIPYTNNTH